MRRRLKAGLVTYAITIGLLLGAVNLISEDIRATSWNVEIIDSAGFVGNYTSIALDSNNYPHISYYDDTNDDLKYARWNGISWTIEVVDSIGVVGLCTSIAVDSNNFPHISYLDWTFGDLKYARWTGIAWIIEVVDWSAAVGWSTSLSLDDNDYPHISYYDFTNQDLKYAKWNGSAWNIEVVDSTDDVGLWTSIAIDSNDYAHISYYDSTNGNLKYAGWSGIIWILDTVDSIDDVGLCTSLALDDFNRPHISYFDATRGALKYAMWNGSAWLTKTVDITAWVGWFTSITLDSNNSPHISYFDYTSGDLKYARSKGFNWSYEIVDEAGRVGWYSSIDLDANNVVHVSYLDVNNGNLKYAKSLPNNPPNVPSTPSGYDTGTVGVTYWYSTSTTDPDGDRIKYTFDWGDGNPSESEYTHSGYPLIHFHIWTISGIFNVRVKATDFDGASSDWSAPLVVTIRDKPGAPLNLTASPGDSQVILSWSPPSDDGCSAITNYSIYRGMTSGNESLLVTIGNVLNYTDLNVTNNQIYYYSVSAVNGIGEGPRSDEVNATPVATPSEPLNLQAIARDGHVTLTWDIPADDGGSAITNYKIYRGTTSGGESFLVTVGDVLTYIDTNVTNGQTYYYRVSAVNGAGEGLQSNKVNATPTSPPIEKSIFEELWFWALIVIIVIALLLIVFLLRRRQKTATISEESNKNLTQ